MPCRLLIFPFLLSAARLFAADGTWTGLTGGNWSDSTKWASSVIANGSGFTANLSTLNPAADVTVNLDAPRTLANLTFGDTDITSPASWVLGNSGTAANKLTLAGTSPTITVNALAAGQSATVSAVIDGSTGFTKAGAGTLVLAAANIYSGPTDISAGVLNVASLSDYGVAGSLGSRSAAAETASGNGIGIHLNGGTLQYTGSTAQSTKLVMIALRWLS